MAYIFWSLSLVSLILATVLYLTRTRWLPQARETVSRLPRPNLSLGTFNFYRYAPVPTSFRGDVEAGLHSTNFDISDNIVGGDERSGLDDAGKKEVLRVMKKRNVGFDEARRIVMEERFRREGIAADGMPRDPKFVSFS